MLLPGRAVAVGLGTFRGHLVVVHILVRDPKPKHLGRCHPCSCTPLQETHVDRLPPFLCLYLPPPFNLCDFSRFLPHPSFLIILNFATVFCLAPTPLPWIFEAPLLLAASSQPSRTTLCGDLAHTRSTRPNREAAEFKMLPRNFFHRLPTPTALLLLSSLMGLASAHVPRQTPTTIPHRPLNVAPYPPLPAPTSPPLDLHALHELLRRQNSNTVCGYINGDASSAATCSAGSHCVQDIDAKVIGCCNDGETCTTGIFTGCVDSNSGGAQTEVNPYVYTCTQGNVCYSNKFEGGFSQFGCGTASDLAATVLASASGVPSAIVILTVDIAFTESPSSLATPTTLGTGAGTVSSSKTSGTLMTITIPTPATTTESSLTTSDSSSTTSTSAPTAAPAISTTTGGGSNHTGAIVGGSIGGVAALVGLAALAAFLYRRRMAGNSRQGPGPRPGDTQYISPMSNSTAYEGLNGQSSPHGTVGGKPITHITGSSETRNTLWQPDKNMADQKFLESHPGTAWDAGGAAAMYTSQNYFGDEIPLQSPEADDFANGSREALSRIGEEDEEDIHSGVHGTGMSGNQNTGDLGDSSKPLWLQSKRQSRNLMWT